MNRGSEEEIGKEMVDFKKGEKKQDLVKSAYWVKGKIREHHP